MLRLCRRRLTPVVPLPASRQILPHVAGRSWEGSQRPDNKPMIARALPDMNRTEEHRRKVADWQPVVRVAHDSRMRVAIVGRMNCGKSSLFNALAEDPVAARRQLVRDHDGMTRDSAEGIAKLGDLQFTIIDTPGLVEGRLVEEAMNTIATADAAIFVTSVDSIVSTDETRLIEFLAARRMPTVFVLNKIDLVPDEDFGIVMDAYSDEGLGTPLPVSARRRIGLEGLEASMAPLHHIHQMRRQQGDWALEDLAMSGEERSMQEIQERNNIDRSIRIAIIGRTNSGKSSIINRLIGYERNRVSSESDTTRDAIEIRCSYRGRKYTIIDTAGIRRVRARRTNEFLSALYDESMKAVQFADVVVVVFDATEGHPTNFDISLMYLAAREGRPFILAANKWDAVLDATATAEAIDFKIKRQKDDVQYGTTVVCSAHTGLNLTLLMDQVGEHYDRWNKKVRTSDLTRFWRRFEKSVIIPTKTSRVGRIVQTKARPPTFLLQLQTKNDSERFKPAMERMVRNALVEEFGFKGAPVRILQVVKDNHPDFI